MSPTKKKRQTPARSAALVRKERCQERNKICREGRAQERYERARFSELEGDDSSRKGRLNKRALGPIEAVGKSFQKHGESVQKSGGSASDRCQSTPKGADSPKKRKGTASHAHKVNWDNDGTKKKRRLVGKRHESAAPCSESEGEESGSNESGDDIQLEGPKQRTSRMTLKEGKKRLGGVDEWM